ncbi:MAG TPA: PilZ domain-containing protein [Terriglobales bacterium]|nr:PilZ domain-containing protein [Terriglobales bacterium]
MAPPKQGTRRWQRLPIAFPVFLHSVDREGNPYLEFGTALNVSAGGVLIAVRRPPASKHIRLEIPVSPILPKFAIETYRSIKAHVVRTELTRQFTFMGVEFDQPLTLGDCPRELKSARTN